MQVLCAVSLLLASVRLEAQQTPHARTTLAAEIRDSTDRILREAVTDRAFPGAYLRQRWRYRVKTGQRTIRDGRIYSFLLAGTVTILCPPLWIPYFVITLILGARTTRLPKSSWPLLPFAFALHHLTYYFGILWGRLVFYTATS